MTHPPDQMDPGDAKDSFEPLGRFLTTAPPLNPLIQIEQINFQIFKVTSLLFIRCLTRKIKEGLSTREVSSPTCCVDSVFEKQESENMELA